MIRTQAEEQNLEDAHRFVKLSPVQEATDNGLLEDSSIIDPQEPLVQPTPNNPPWNSLVAIGVWILSVVFIGLVPLIFVTPYALSKGYSSNDGGRLHDFLMSDPTACNPATCPDHPRSRSYSRSCMVRSYKVQNVFFPGNVRLAHERVQGLARLSDNRSVLRDRVGSDAGVR
jgi:hypothetical protein